MRPAWVATVFTATQRWNRGVRDHHGGLFTTCQGRLKTTQPRAGPLPAVQVEAAAARANGKKVYNGNTMDAPDSYYS